VLNVMSLHETTGDVSVAGGARMAVSPQHGWSMLTHPFLRLGREA
jgi:hypothetical protein